MDQAAMTVRSMRLRTVLLALALLTALGPVPEAGQGSAAPPATRVERFPRPAKMRVTAPGDAKEGLTRQPCPNTLEMCRKFWAIAGHFLNNAAIPIRDRELLVLRTAYLGRVDYQWGHHYGTYGPKAGLTPEDIARVMVGPGAEGWSAFDAALLRAADELHSTRFVSDATWKTLAGRYTDHQLVEVVLTVGNYTMLGMYFNSLGVPVEPGHSRVPD